MDKPRKTEFEQITFYNQCYEKYIEASAKAGKIRYFYNLAETTVCLEFAGETMVPFITPALEHLRIPEVKKPDITICVWESESTGVEMVKPPCKWDCFTDRGDIWGFNSKRIKTAFHWGEFSVNIMDLETNTGIYWMQTSKTLPFWVYSSPLRTLFHWWMEKNNCQLLHAAAVGTENGAVLITGKGGVGKSTTALKCLESGLFYLADDYLFVRAEPEPLVFSLYSTAKLNAEDIERFPSFEKFIVNKNKLEKEKAVMFLYPHLKKQIINAMPLKAIMTPQIENKPETSISGIPAWTIQGAMSFTTMSQLPNVGKHTHDYICNLANILPRYILKLGYDLDKIPVAISEFLANDFHQYETVKDEPKLSKPLISVIMPVYNGEKFIESAIENILSQNYPSLEIIIVDDGSTDRTEEIIQNLNIDIRYFYQENDGPASARNRGIRDASGELIAFLDVDDLWPENNLNLLTNIIMQDPEILAVHGFAQLLEKNKETGKYEYIGNPEESFPGYIGAGLYRKSAFSTVGLFDPFMQFGEDADWFKRAEELDINLKKLNEVTLYVRRHEANMTKGKSLVELNTLKVFKKSLDRARDSATKRLGPIKIVDVSVVIPVYNSEKYLGETIESILDQEIKPQEIIIINDGSTDNSEQIAKRYEPNIIFINQENKGAAAARNVGIQKAKGSLLAFCDADDIWMPDHLLCLLNAMEDDLELDMVSGSVEQFLSPELDEENQHRLRSELKVMPGYHQGAMLFKKRSFMKVGLLNESLQLAEFIDWFSRANDLKLKHKMLDKVVYKRRIHTSNQGISKRNHLQDYTSVLRAALERKRKMQDEV